MRCVREDQDSKKAKRNSARGRRRANRRARPSTAKRLATKNASFRRRKSLTARQKADRDMFLSMRELSELTGFGENRLNRLKTSPGFPLFLGKTTLAKFKEWAFSHSTAVAASAATEAPSSHPVPTLPTSPQTKAYPPFR